MFVLMLCLYDVGGDFNLGQDVFLVDSPIGQIILIILKEIFVISVSLKIDLIAKQPTFDLYL